MTTLQQQVRTRLVNGKARTETYYLVACHTCQQERWLRKHDAAKNAVCLSCSQSAKGKLGYQVTVTRYGTHFAVTFVQRYRLAHPSCLEQQLMTMLDNAELPYEREVSLPYDGHHYLIDFVIDDWIAVEVNGSYVHQFNPARDHHKGQGIWANGYALLVLDESTLTDAITHIQHLMS